MLTLYQAEWCPYSQRVRERLTELGIDFVAKQVEPYPEERDETRRATGEESIPVLVTEDGAVYSDADSIIAYLDERFDEPPSADGHRAQVRAHSVGS